MAAIEEKLVRLNLDNNSFVKKAEESTSIFNKLKQAFSKTDALSFDDASKSAGKLSTAVNGVELSGLQKAIDTVNSRFSVMGEMGAAALQRISNAAINTGQALLNNVVTQPMKDGFGEYELQMKSIQTMLNNVDGATLDSVTNSLDTLNDYADKTIYSFSDMTSAMSKFTLAGIGIEDSQVAIMGLSNLAADAGVQNAQLANAQYQLSQALQAGSVRLMDWRSMENMGLGTQKFREALVAEAQALGTLEDGFDMSTFRDSLSEGWMTTDVVMGVLKDFAKDPAMLDAATKIRTLTQLVETFQEVIGSGWLKTWENIFGDYDESTEFFSNFNDDIVDPSIQAFSAWHNGLSGAFKDLGGRTHLINGIYNAFNALSSVMSVVGGAWRSVFPPMTGERLVQMAQGFENFTKSMILTGDTADRLQYIIRGIFAAFDSVGTIVSTVASTLSKVFTSRLAEGFTDILLALSELSIGFNDSLQSGEGLLGFIESFGPKLETVGNLIGVAMSWIAVGIRNVGPIITYVGSVISQLANLVSTVFVYSIQTAVSAISEFIASFSSGIGSTGSILKDAFGVVGSVVSTIVSIVSKAGGILKRVFDYLTANMDIADVIGAGMALGLVGIGKAILTVGENLEEFVESTAAPFTSFGDNVSGMFTKIGDGISSIFDVGGENSLLTISVSLLALAAALSMIEDMSYEGIGKGLITIALGISAISVATKTLSGLTGGGTRTLLALSVSMLAIGSAISSIGKLNPGNVLAASTAIAISLGAIVLSVKSLEGVKMGKIKQANSTILTMAISMRVLASAINVLAGLSLGDLAKGMLGVAGGLAGLAIAVKALSNVKISPAVAGTILSLALSVSMLVIPIALLGALKWEILARGVATIAAGMAAMVLALKGLSGLKLAGASVGLLAMSIAINSLIAPILILGSLGWETIAKGLVAIGGGMLILVGGLAAMSSIGAKSATAIPALLTLAAAINMMVVPMKQMAGMGWEELARGLVGVGAGIALLVAGMAGMAMIGGAATLAAPALLMLAGALNMLIGPIERMSLMSWEQLAKGVLGVSVALAAIGGVAGILGSTAGPGMLIFSAAALALGSALVVASLGVGMFSVAIQMMAGAIVTVVEMFPRIVAAIGDLASALSTAGGQIVDLLVAVVDIILRVIVEAGTLIVDAVIDIAQLIASRAPEFTVAALSIIAAFLNGISLGLKPIVDAGILLVASLINGISEAIASNSGYLFAAIKSLINAIVVMLGEGLATLVEDISIFGKDVGSGIADSIRNNLAPMKEGIESNGEAIKEEIKANNEEINDIIKSTGKEAKESSKEYSEGIGEGLEEGMAGISGIIASISDAMSEVGASGPEGVMDAFNSLDFDFDFDSFMDGLKSNLSTDQMGSLFEDWGIPEPELDWDFSDDADGMFEPFVTEAQGVATEIESTVIPEVDATAAHIVAAFKDGMTDTEFEALGASWGYDFSRGIYNEHGSITDAGVETVLRLEEAITASGNMEEIGEILGLDLSNSLTHHGGQYVTETGAQLMRQLVAGMSDEDLTALTALLGFDITTALAENTAEGAREAGAQTVEEYAGGVAHSSGSLNLAGQTAGTEVRAGINKGISTDDGTVAASLTSVVTTALDAITANIEAGGAFSAGTTMMTKLKEGIESVNLTSSGETQGNQYKTGVESVDAEGSGTTIATAVEAGILTVTLLATGRTLGEGFASGVSNTRGTASAAGSEIAGAAKAGAEGVSAFSAGQSFAAGFARGISSGAFAATIAARAMASAAKSAAEKAIDARSPARELIKLGKNFSLGMAIGIKDKAQEAVQSARNMATDSMGVLRNTAMSLMQKINDDLSMNPVITPVLDDSNIRDVDLGQNEKLLSLNSRQASQYSAYTGSYLRSLNQDPAPTSKETVIDIDINNPTVSDQTDLDAVKRQIYETVDEVMGNKLYSRRRGQAG